MGMSRINSRYAASSASSCAVEPRKELVASACAATVGKAVEVRPIGDVAWEATSVVDANSGEASTVIGAAVVAELVEAEEAGGGDKAASGDGRT